MTRLPSSIRLLALFGLLAVLSPSAVAQPFSATLDQAVDGEPGTTYLDLVRLIAPDLTEGDGSFKAEKLLSLRHIGGYPDQKGKDFTSAVVGPITVLPAMSGGEERLLLLFDFDQSVGSPEGFAVLALFDLTGEPAMLDAANVAFDRWTGFFDPAKLGVEAGEDIVLTTSNHFNSNQAYQRTALIGLRGDRLRLIDTIFTFNDRACGFERSQAPRFSVGDSSSGPFIHASVTEEIRLIEPGCEGTEARSEGSRTVSVTYRWQPAAGRYLKDSDALDRLAEETARRF